VILYHFGLPGFGGGFVGVDVFFVISGFLMTQIIVGGLDKHSGEGGFSLLRFYLARARRIVPALVVLCATLLLLGWFILPSADYRVLGNHVMTSLAFISNFRFLREAGYFDAASHEKWLLHTWSLSVEWQFYLILPLLLLAVWKLRPGRQAATVFVGAAFSASLALSIILTPSKPEASFYLLTTRAWEMLAGGLVYLLAQKWQPGNKAMEGLGFGLIIGSVLLFDSNTTWPDWHALMPVAGASFVLGSARPQSVWTGNRIAQWLGTRSYSLYLWHWPVVVALVYLELQHDAVAIVAGLVITLVLGQLSYKLVETPARTKLGQLRLRHAAAVITLASLVVAAPGAAARMKDGFPGRLSEQIELAAQEANNTNPRRELCHVEKGVASPSCVYGGAHLSAILIGDSHADAVATAFAAAVPSKNDGIMEWSYAGCATLIGAHTLPGVGGNENRCGEFNVWALKRLQDFPAQVPLVIVNRTSLYAKGYNEPWAKPANAPFVFFTKSYASPQPEFLQEFAQHLVDSACEFAKTRPVYLVRPIPEMGIDVPKEVSRRTAFGMDEDVSIPLDEYHARHALVWAAQDAAHKRCGVRILDPLPYLCSEGRCYGSRKGRPLYSDDDHLSEYGNRLLVPMFAQVFVRQ
ncbi:MAG: acyltransferase family protein, partial [Hyphomicrobiales bacterium]